MDLELTFVFDFPIPIMMEYEEYENPADGGDGMDVEPGVDELEDEDIPVTQEDAWAVIRYALFELSFYVVYVFIADSVP